jgi:hypothetical protein
MLDTALPPDVRRWLGPADNIKSSLGYALGSGLVFDLLDQTRTKGIAQIYNRRLYGGA